MAYRLAYPPSYVASTLPIYNRLAAPYHLLPRNLTVLFNGGDSRLTSSLLYLEESKYCEPSYTVIPGRKLATYSCLYWFVCETSSPVLLVVIDMRGFCYSLLVVPLLPLSYSSADTPHCSRPFGWRRKSVIRSHCCWPGRNGRPAL